MRGRTGWFTVLPMTISQRNRTLAQKAMESAMVLTTMKATPEVRAEAWETVRHAIVALRWIERHEPEIAERAEDTA